MHRLAAAREAGARHRPDERLVHRGEEAERHRRQHHKRLHELAVVAIARSTSTISKATRRKSGLPQ